MTVSVPIDKVFDHLRKTSPIVISVAIVSGIILFAPIALREKLFLTGIPVGWMRGISAIFLFSVFLTLLLAIESASRFVKKKVKRMLTVKRYKKQYLKFNALQKDIVLRALQSQTGYVPLGLTDGNAQYLMNIGYLFRPSQSLELDYNSREPIAKYVPQPWLVTEYNKDPSFFVRNGDNCDQL